MEKEYEIEKRIEILERENREIREKIKEHKEEIKLHKGRIYDNEQWLAGITVFGLIVVLALTISIIVIATGPVTKEEVIPTINESVLTKENWTDKQSGSTVIAYFSNETRIGEMNKICKVYCAYGTNITANQHEYKVEKHNETTMQCKCW